MTTSSKEDVKKVCDALFIAQYHTLFNKFITILDSDCKHMIRNHKQLNDMYDLVLDFVIDSSHQLDYNKQTKK